MIFAKFELPQDKWEKIKPTLENCHIVELGVINTLFAVDILFDGEPNEDLLIYEVFPDPIGIHTFAGCEELYTQRFCDFNPLSPYCNETP
jgi:hypothetical protein